MYVSSFFYGILKTIFIHVQKEIPVITVSVSWNLPHLTPAILLSEYISVPVYVKYLSFR